MSTDQYLDKLEDATPASGIAPATGAAGRREDIADVVPALVAIGTSSGGLAALTELVQHLPATLAAPVLLVQHLGHRPSHLPDLLQPHCALPVSFALDGAPLQAGVYVAPPDRHLLVDRQSMQLSRGPRENFSRPAINPTFRAVAQAFGARAIGVVLTGQLDDGTAGLFELKRRGGIAIVQDPSQAEYPSMPRNALDHVGADHCAPLDRIGQIIASVVERMQAQPDSVRALPAEEDRPMGYEERFQTPVALTCPDCGGAARASRWGSVVEFRCHIGHRFSPDSLAAAQRDALEHAGERLLRSLSEWIEICRQREAEAADGSAVDPAWTTMRHRAEQRRQQLLELLNAPL